jgi:hypothetical protein
MLIYKINNTGVWPSGYLIALYYGWLNPDQIYSATPASSRPSPGAGVSPLDPIGSDGSHEDGTTTLSLWLVFVM